MQYNLPHPREMTGQNHTKLLECLFIYQSLSHEIHKQMNQSFEKINLWGISHANRNTKTSSEKIQVVKEFVLAILKL